jgi:hypothetical protein
MRKFSATRRSSRLRQETSTLPDQKPLDEGVNSVLPDAKIR